MRVIVSARRRFLLLLCISIALSIGGGLLFPIGLQETQRPAAAGQPFAQSEGPAGIFYPNPAEILFLAEQYLSLSIPDFNRYGLASFEYTGGYTADRVSFTCTSAGEVLQIELPRTQKYVNMTAKEKEGVADKLPSRGEVEQYALEQMRGKYGEKLRAMEIESIGLSRENGAWKLYVWLVVRTEMVVAVIPHTDMVIYPVE